MMPGAAAVALLLLLLAGPASARDPKVAHQFRLTHRCPSTGQLGGACPGYVVDHVVPLCWGGEDAPANMQWQEVEVSKRKDAFEREACRLKRHCAP